MRALFYGDAHGARLAWNNDVVDQRHIREVVPGFKSAPETAADGSVRLCHSTASGRAEGFGRGVRSRGPGRSNFWITSAVEDRAGPCSPERRPGTHRARCTGWPRRPCPQLGSNCRGATDVIVGRSVEPRFCLSVPLSASVSTAPSDRWMVVLPPQSQGRRMAPVTSAGLPVHRLSCSDRWSHHMATPFVTEADFDPLRPDDVNSGLYYR